MLKRIIFIALVVAVIASVHIYMVQKKTTSTNVPIAPDKPKNVIKNTHLQIKSSIPYWDQENAFISFQNNITKHDYVNIFWYYLTDDNAIATYEYADEDRSIISMAHDNNVKVFATITNLPEEGGWDSERVENMLRTKDSRKKHIDDIIEKLNEWNFDGVNIDYEEVNKSQKNKFSMFISELAEALHRDNKLLSISLHPKRAGNEGLGKFQDWKKLSLHADQLTIMAFNEHYDEGEAGPIASIPWLEKIVAYSQYLEIPGEKVFLGIPFFGYDWNHDNDEAAVGLTYAGVQSLLNTHEADPKWDDTFKSPFFTYENDGDEHEVWYEDAQSVKEKIDLAQRTGLAGVSFWRLGGEDPQAWRGI
jgi:spore germination protein